MQLGGTQQQYTRPSIFFAPVAQPAIESLLKRSPIASIPNKPTVKIRKAGLVVSNAEEKTCFSFQQWIES